MIPCDLCGSTDFHEIEVARKYTNDQPLHVCGGCGLVQVLERRSSKEIYEAWQGAKPGDEVYHSAKAAVAARHAYVAEIIRPPKDAEIIDVGAGDGAFLGLLVDRFDARGVSWGGMAEDLPELNTYNFATLLWTLENCGSCTDVVKAAHRVLKPGGTIVVATGSRILVPFKKPLSSYLGTGPADLHPWRFSFRTLRKLLMRNGFGVPQVNSYLDSDYLVMTAKKTDDLGAVLPGDRPRDVIDFFNRWDKDTREHFA